MSRAKRKGRALHEQADRLTLIDRWGYLVPDQPVLVHPGETIWRAGDRLLVQRLDGRVDAYPCFVNR
ncbi:MULTISPECIES: hypothetical protein [unclassified Micromonospora]|uniref:hypothetical protein n=1 Tax=Micromonospora sp. NPDC005206 TaxID=3157022 RepID=UPI00339F3F13